jgi:hypothetical protein
MLFLEAIARFVKVKVVRREFPFYSPRQGNKTPFFGKKGHASHP